ncbi:DNA-directed RNA polymerase subunit K [Candidatus Pacearchaeota archaeon]|nr:DNA-directed RNA polymerase subunit K [Candidatus Pacearchaeota archaeon]
MPQLQELTKYEKARIIGARALQIAMNAPLLVKMDNEDLEKINFDALKIAEVELNSGVLPISVHKPLPDKKVDPLKRTKKVNLSEAQKQKLEEQEEEEIEEEGEIMQLANPDDEGEDSEESNESE